MRGYIYISGAFKSLTNSVCGSQHGWIENDPHFWASPPTWGICRWDLRQHAAPGDYVFFVLPASFKLHGHRLPQMIYGYFRITEVITHEEAFGRPNLKAKRMRTSKNPNGNIIVDAHGGYHVADRNVHRRRFNEISKFYAVGDDGDSEFLLHAPQRIQTMEDGFIPTLREVFARPGRSAIDLISRSGKVMKEAQVRTLLEWLRV